MRANSVLDKIIELAKVLYYVVAGIPLLIIGCFADTGYFWLNNFRSNLK